MLALLTLSGAVSGAAIATYVFDKTSPLTTRLAVATVLGLTFYALAGFTAAMVFGPSLFSLAVAIALAMSPVLLLAREPTRRHVIADCRSAVVRARLALSGRQPGGAALAAFALFVVVVAVLLPVFTRAIYAGADGIYTGVFANRYDVPLHVSIIQGFVSGGNLPPQHPEFAGARLTYPFLVDFGAAQLVLAGLSLYHAIAVQNVVLVIALVVLLHRWALTFTGDRVAALIVPPIVLFGSGLGWLVFALDAAQTRQPFLDFLWNLPYDYTINTRNLRWGNLTTTILVSQRSFLLGLPLFLIASMLWWRSLAAADGRPPGRAGDSDKSLPLMCAAGVSAGLLPLAHPHSFLVLMAAAACLTILFRHWRLWAIFFTVAAAIATPQLWWIGRDSGIDSRQFIAWHYGWTKETESLPWFWFKNTGLFIPLVVATIAARGRWRILPQRLLLFYLPFIGCFVIPLLVRLAPRPSANIKVLVYWYIASTLLVAMGLARVWRAGTVARGVVVAVIATLTLSAGLDVWRVASGASSVRVFDSAGVSLATLVEQATPPNAVLLHAPMRQPPTALSGRLSVLADLLHVGSHGFSYVTRKDDVGRIYAGDPDSLALLQRYDVDYVVVGPAERLTLGARDSVFRSHQLVGTAGEYNLYRVVYPNAALAHRLQPAVAADSTGSRWSTK